MVHVDGSSRATSLPANTTIQAAAASRQLPCPPTDGYVETQVGRRTICDATGDFSMRLRTSPATALPLLAILAATLASSAASAQVSSAPSTQPDGLRALDGEWLFIEDRTEG